LDVFRRVEVVEVQDGKRGCYLYRLLRRSRRSSLLKSIIKFAKFIELFAFLKLVEIISKSAI